jgi:hypothetical protein
LIAKENFEPIRFDYSQMHARLSQRQALFMSYKHTQIGWLMLTVCGLLLLFFVSAAIAVPDLLARPVFLFGTISFLGTIMVLFSSLTVAVEDKSIAIRFGPGLIWKTIWLGDIVACEPVKNRWWWGWGIQLIHGGWLFNVSGLDAVELSMKSGKVYRIGTDEPQKLAESIRVKLSKIN